MSDEQNAHADRVAAQLRMADDDSEWDWAPLKTRDGEVIPPGACKRFEEAE